MIFYPLGSKLKLKSPAQVRIMFSGIGVSSKMQAHCGGSFQDEILLQRPQGEVVSQLELFVCTYAARLGNLHIGLDILTKYLSPSGGILAINSNFGHKALPGYERYKKFQKKPILPGGILQGRVRKLQGDGTCFNSAIEPVISICHPGVAKDKIYLLKCFPTTGETQIPGIICRDLSDGHATLETFINFLNESQVGDLVTPKALEKQNLIPRTDEEWRGASTERDASFAPNMKCFCSTSCTASRAEHVRKSVVLISEKPKMLNYKFCVNFGSPRLRVNLRILAKFLQKLEDLKALQDFQDGWNEKTADGWLNILFESSRPGGLDLPFPPYLIRETKPPLERDLVSVRFKVDKRLPRVKIFRSGKINILGASSEISAQRIYTFFTKLFEEKWDELVRLQPQKDRETHRQRARDRRKDMGMGR